MNVNEKGVKGLIKVIDDLQHKGYYTFIPFDDHSPIDLIAVSKLGQVIRLQIKYREPCLNKKSEKYELPCSSVVNGKKIQIDRTLIDGWALYMANRNEIKYIPVAAMNDHSTSLTIDPDKNYGKVLE